LEVNLVEASSSRVSKLKEKFQSYDLKINIFDEIPLLSRDSPIVVIANEFFDSLPFSVVLYSGREKVFKELFISCNSDGEFF
jgi:SAM-dependent MidA family methyltransferase